MHRGKRAVIIGAGIGGLCAASAVAPFFEHVLILEADVLPTLPEPRKGTPQSKHAHALVAGGRLALEALFSGFEPQLLAAGAIPCAVSSDYWLGRPGYDPYPKRSLGFSTYSMTRPLIEGVIRNFVNAINNVEIRDRCNASRLTISKKHNRVTSVECHFSLRGREQVGGDLFIDATGNGLPTLNCLAPNNRLALEESIVDLDIRYASAQFAKPANCSTDWKCAIAYPDPPNDRNGGFIFPVEDDSWIVSLSGRFENKPPKDAVGFLAHAKDQRTSTIYDAIRSARRRTEIVCYGMPASRWRHFERLNNFPRRLVPFGDSICRFNPVYGQGMGVAAQEACLLREILCADGGDMLDTVCDDFLSKSPALVDTPWNTAVIPDFKDPLTMGVRPNNIESAFNTTAALLKLASEDPDVHRLMMEVQHLLKPRSALQAPGIKDRLASISSKEKARRHFALHNIKGMPWTSEA
jgi:2-polyprenyl-6-methoxyphenol hydroxylase-like FAD-dependent oxidoreductase